ncbi:LytR family transcriptional regulator [Bacillus timonensis]|uniref:LytR family transcriptional regulator n=1 Tax=Bacillus timonensis TaxID=1033734 RepID=A0A4S3PRM9_9BACI|nr:LCP family protein [Bacillus timonensis]THE12309.1 LytR family transcriptional regulator [Bacillus timonensis]
MDKKRKRYEVRKKKRKRRVFLYILFPLLILLVAGGAYSAYLVNKAKNVAADSKTELNRGIKSEKRVEPVNPKHDNISILFIGVDDSKKRSQGDATRTDALILATLNEKQKSIKMVSIPRDSFVYDPLRGRKDKINHAHVYNGVDGTIATVEELLDIPVDYFVKMNFDAFIDVVEALNGIQVDVPVTFTEQDSKDRPDAIHLEKGLQKLNGEEALALVRTRKIDSDIERGKRQQLVIKGIIDKAISVGSISKYGSVIDALGENITMNFEFGELLSLYDYATSGQTLEIESNVLAGSDLWTDYGYYYEVNQQELKTLSKTLRDHLEIDVTGQRNDAHDDESSTLYE